MSLHFDEPVCDNCEFCEHLEKPRERICMLDPDDPAFVDRDDSCPEWSPNVVYPA